MVPLACCRHSFASGNWSCSRLLPSTSALCGSILAKANLQSLFFENLSLENLDWLSSFWNFCQQPVASADCRAGVAKTKALEEAANDPFYGVRPRSSNKDPPRHIAILPSYGVQPSTLSSAMIVVTFTSTCQCPHFARSGTRAPGAVFSEPPRGDPKTNTFIEILNIYIYIFIYLFYLYLYICRHKVSCHTWKLWRRQQVLKKVARGDNTAVGLIRSVTAVRMLRSATRRQRAPMGQELTFSSISMIDVIISESCQGMIKLQICYLSK